MAEKTKIHQAKESFDQGIEHLLTGTYSSAKHSFREVIRVCRGPSMLFGLSVINYSSYINYAFFAIGLADGLTTYNSLTEKPGGYFKTASRLLSRSRDSIKKPKRWGLKEEGYCAEMGRGFGLLGLKEEGLLVLESRRQEHILRAVGYEYSEQ